jgi:hypothetical protein
MTGKGSPSGAAGGGNKRMARHGRPVLEDDMVSKGNGIVGRLSAKHRVFTASGFVGAGEVRPEHQYRTLHSALQSLQHTEGTDSVHCTALHCVHCTLTYLQCALHMVCT